MIVREPPDQSAGHAVWDLRFANPDDALRRIACALRKPEGVDPTLAALLADQLDPDVPGTFTGTKLVVSRGSDRRGPPKAPNHELAAFLELHVHVFGAPRGTVVAEAMKRFGVSERTCSTALADCRRRQQERPKLFEFYKQWSRLQREAGDLDFAPLTGCK